jgi:hypothetical protein
MEATFVARQKDNIAVLHAILINTPCFHCSAVHGKQEKQWRSHGGKAALD